jgi:hypothetical protein
MYTWQYLCRRIRQRRDTTGAPTREPEWRGDERRPFWDEVAKGSQIKQQFWPKATNPGSARAESSH